ncbi:MAG: tetratricopeptide repeat protein [Paucibacter sp.]|nr:tetratricopeptide repeat protein [Roseateles sp.]
MSRSTHPRSQQLQRTDQYLDWGLEIGRAQQALRAQQWEQAAELCQQLLQAATLGGQLTQAWLTLARARWHQGDLPASYQAALQAKEAAQRCNDAASAISAATLAAFALAELGLADQAWALAEYALALAEQPAMFKLLPTALSCAAHAHARRADLPHSESLHMRALSFARESGDPKALQLAYDNLLLSFIFLLRSAQQQGQTRLVDAVQQRARNYAPQIRSLIDSPQLIDWRRISLMHNLGELLSLCADLDAAQTLLEASLEQARKLSANYSTLSALIALAELSHRRGDAEAALAYAAQSLAMDEVRTAGHLLHSRCMQIAETCYRAQGRSDEADAIAERMNAARQRHQSVLRALTAQGSLAAV